MSNENVYQAPQSDLRNDAEQTSNEAPIEYAGFWVRVLASIIDSIMIMLVTLPVLTAVYGTQMWTNDKMYQGTFDVLMTYVFPVIVIVLFWVYKSATPGKMVCNIEIVNDGPVKKLGVGQALARYLCYYISMLALFLGFIWVAIDKRKRGFHDIITNTIVVKKAR